MAKAKAKCKCVDCGKEFEKTKMCRNTREANEWEEWAAVYIDTCPSCYGKQQKEAEIEKGLYFDVRLDPTGMVVNGYQTVAIVFGGDTMPYKDAIKGLGARWTENYPSDGLLKDLLGFGKPISRWVLWTDFDEIKEAMQKAESIGAKVNKVPNNADMNMYAAMIQKSREQKGERTVRSKRN